VIRSTVVLLYRLFNRVQLIAEIPLVALPSPMQCRRELMILPRALLTKW